MALPAIEGIYQDGAIELKEKPVGLENARVIVTFLPDDTLTKEETRREAMNWLFARMEQGMDFGGLKFDRNALYEERMRELDARRGQE